MGLLWGIDRLHRDSTELMIEEFFTTRMFYCVDFVSLFGKRWIFWVSAGFSLSVCVIHFSKAPIWMANLQLAVHSCGICTENLNCKEYGSKVLFLSCIKSLVNTRNRGHMRHRLCKMVSNWQPFLPYSSQSSLWFWPVTFSNEICIGTQWVLWDTAKEVRELKSVRFECKSASSAEIQLWTSSWWLK